MIMEYWDIDKRPSSFLDDFYLPALVKFMTGVDSVLKEGQSFDIRAYTSRFSLTNLERRLRDSSQFSNL